MFRNFLNPKLNDNLNALISSLIGWERIILISTFAGSILFFILFSFFVNRTKKLDFVGGICFLISIILFYSTLWLFLSFPYDNSYGWFDGVLFFVAQAILFFSAILLMPVILYLCLGVKKMRQLYDWKLWAYFVCGLIVIGTSIGILSHLLEKPVF